MSRYRAALAAVAIIAGVVAIGFSWQPGLASLYDESVSYLLVAQAFSPFHSSDLVVLEAARQERYPPLPPGGALFGLQRWSIGVLETQAGEFMLFC
jgi:hypothetical protein